MATEKLTNSIAGTGQHGHEVPDAEGRVVLIRDGHHEGTSVWQRGEKGTDQTRFVFVSHDAGRVSYAARCLMAVGQSLENLPDGTPFGCDMDAPRGVLLIGVNHDDDLSWLDADADIEWSSWDCA